MDFRRLKTNYRSSGERPVHHQFSDIRCFFKELRHYNKKLYFCKNIKKKEYVCKSGLQFFDNILLYDIIIHISIYRQYLGRIYQINIICSTYMQDSSSGEVIKVLNLLRDNTFSIQQIHQNTGGRIEGQYKQQWWWWYL